ncbi:MAG: OmpA family protein [Alphaproteobacteria bacterium]|nr:OmpA family protein [Alphaproteobacteria bacterium]
MRKILVAVASLFALTVLPVEAREQSSMCRTDTIGASGTALRVQVCFGLEERSWADRTISLSPGNPIRCGWEKKKDDAVGHNNGNNVHLGSGGTLILEFEDPGISDFLGVDLWIFEFGSKKEPLDVFVSSDLDEGSWGAPVGRVSGNRSFVDIAVDDARRGKSYRYVKLVDLSHLEQEAECVSGDWDYPGAEIDAVGTNICSVMFDPDDLAFFDTAQSALRDDARERLEPVIELLESTVRASVSIHGYADERGTQEQNLPLSARRAEAVADFLRQNLPDRTPDTLKFETLGLGELPGSAEEWEGNRRVEIEVLPAGPNACPQLADQATP